MDRIVGGKFKLGCGSFGEIYLATHVDTYEIVAVKIRPDYGFVKRLFRELFTSQGYEFDYVFDWTVLKYRQGQKQKKSPGAPIARPIQAHVQEQADVNGVFHHNEAQEHVETSRPAGQAAQLQLARQKGNQQ